MPPASIGLVPHARMRPRDLDTLELPKILDALAAHAASIPGAERCRALAPTPDLAGATGRLDTLAQFRALATAHPHGPRIDVADVRPLLALAAHDGAVLDGRDLAIVLGMLRLAAAVRRYLDRAPPAATGLSALAQALEHPVALERALGRALDDSGHLRDEASPALTDVRASIRALRADLETRLTETIAAAGPTVATEHYVTLRSDRFVIPVRAGAAHHIPGVIQDRSASGETIFLEPLFAVDLNNRLVLQRRAEDAEVRRICGALTAEIRVNRSALASVFEALVECDVLAARAAFAHRLDAVIPTLGALEIRLHAARHPLLLLAGRAAVPIDLLIPAGRHGLVISGPNTGGKTVALKTIGLLAAMAQSGLAIPAAEGSALPCFAAIFADIGDTQSIERNLSTFSAHMENLAEIARVADGRTLVLLDEPGVGTDPAEGAALAVGLLGHLRDRRAFVAASSHSADVKTFALADAGFDVAAVDVDPTTGTPRYRLQYHTLGQSLALATARRMGLPDPILATATAHLAGTLGPDVLRAAERLETTRRAYEEKLAEAEREREALAARTAEHAELVAALKAKTARAWDEAVAEARAFVNEMRAAGRRTLEEMRQAGADRRALEAAVAAQETAIATAAERHGGGAIQEDPPQIGDTVEVTGQGIRGELVDVAGERAHIRRGALRFEVPTRSLKRIPGGAPRGRGRDERAPGYREVRDADTPAVANEITLLGLGARDAIARLDEYLDRAVRAGHASVRIIHGIGGGVLRRAVLDYLDGSPYCTRFREGRPAEGGVGVTLVELAG